jgi:hypothetical protein
VSPRAPLAPGRLLAIVALSAMIVASSAGLSLAAPALRISVADASIMEGWSGRSAAQVHISVVGLRGRDVAVGWSTADGSATAGEDYEAASGTVTLTRSHPTGSVAVNVHGDQLDEPDEWFSVRLTGADRGRVIDDTAIVTIEDDDVRLDVTVQLDPGARSFGAERIVGFGISCSPESSSDCTAMLPEGFTFTYEAEHLSGSLEEMLGLRTVVMWRGCDSTTAYSCEVQMDDDRSITARYSYALT